MTLPAPARAVITLHDAAGRLVRTLASGEFEAGPHVIAWDGRDEAGRDCASGLYFARARAARWSGVARILRVR